MSTPGMSTPWVHPLPWPWHALTREMRLGLFCDVLHTIGAEATATDWRWPS